MNINCIIPFVQLPNDWLKNLRTLQIDVQLKFPNYLFNYVLISDGCAALTVNEITQINNYAWHYIAYATNMGKGFAVRKGIECKDADIYIYTDIDIPFANENVLEMIDILMNNDVVIGVRDNIYYNSIPFQRRCISKLFQWVTKIIFNLEISDTQTGLKGFRHSIKSIFLQTKTNRFLFDLEFLLLVKQQFKITAMLVRLHNNKINIFNLRVKVILEEVINFVKILYRML